MEVNSRHSIIFQRISDMDSTVESVTTGFYKFLARFSGMSISQFLHSLRFRFNLRSKIFLSSKPLHSL